MDLVHRSLRPVDQDLLQAQHQGRPYLLHNQLSQAVTAIIQVMYNRAMDYTARPAANMVLEEPELIRQQAKATKVANTEDTKALEATIMAIASNVAVGVATTDTN